MPNKRNSSSRWSVGSGSLRVSLFSFLVDVSPSHELFRNLSQWLSRRDEVLSLRAAVAAEAGKAGRYQQRV